MNAKTMVRQLNHALGESEVNELGKLTRLCRRERDITPHRLAMALIGAMADNSVSIADLHRYLNHLCQLRVQYKPLHKQMAKRAFPEFMRLLLSRLLSRLACTTLRFSAHSPFARFRQIRLQDGTSFAVKSTLAGHFPGRFTRISPAAIELHVDLDLLSETANSVALAPDCEAERHFLPDPSALQGDLLLADRGYFCRDYLDAVQRAGGHFIIRGTASMNPLILNARDAAGRPVKGLAGRHLKDVTAKLKRHTAIDLDVRYTFDNHNLDCRLVVHPHLREHALRYLATNLERQSFSVEQISDAYRLRWQIELLFKEWKSHASLHAFGTRNPAIAEGLVWAALCAATLTRHCAHLAETWHRVAISTRRTAICIHHVLAQVLHAMLHAPRTLASALLHLFDYLAVNARRSNLKRDASTGRLKLNLQHVFVRP